MVVVFCFHEPSPSDPGNARIYWDFHPRNISNHLLCFLIAGWACHSWCGRHARHRDMVCTGWLACIVCCMVSCCVHACATRFRQMNSHCSFSSLETLIQFSFLFLDAGSQEACGNFCLRFSLPSFNQMEIRWGLKCIRRKGWKSVWQTDHIICGFTWNQAKTWGWANDNKESYFIVKNLNMVKK